MSYSWELRNVLHACKRNVDHTGESVSPLYIRIGSGRFSGSLGRLKRFEVETPSGRSRGRGHPKAFAYVIFEPEGRAYKIQVYDGYQSDHQYIESGERTTDADLLKVDDQARDALIPEVFDRYGTLVSIGTMAVVLTHNGLKVGTLKKVTPKGTLTFKDFDQKDATFSKAIVPGSQKCVEILVLQKDLMDQMMIRKLARI